MQLVLESLIPVLIWMACFNCVSERNKYKWDYVCYVCCSYKHTCCRWYLLHIIRRLVWRVNSSEKMADNLEQQSELFGGSEDASSVCDEERVRKLFQACDGDGDEYIDRYLRTFFSFLVSSLSSLVLVAPVFSSDFHTVLKIICWRTCSAESK